MDVFGFNLEESIGFLWHTFIFMVGFGFIFGLIRYMLFGIPERKE
jgi:hypothetical protein